MAENKQTLPVHLGIIMDGNRRWAKAAGLPTLQGHQQGLEVFKDIVLATFDRGVPYISAFVFSTENWQRTQEEVSYLMGLVSKGISKHLKTFDEAGIKLLMLGSRQGVDAKVLKQIDQAIAKTSNNSRGTLGLCFNYGGQEEIVAAAQTLLDQGEKELTIDKLQAELYAPQMPAIDLIIRTSGEQRLSGFMLWRAAYSEFYFSAKHWPDFTAGDIDIALADYAQRQRRFGQ